jgi:hypothetical protein
MTTPYALANLASWNEMVCGLGRVLILNPAYVGLIPKKKG